MEFSTKSETRVSSENLPSSQVAVGRWITGVSQEQIHGDGEFRTEKCAEILASS